MGHTLPGEAANWSFLEEVVEFADHTKTREISWYSEGRAALQRDAERLEEWDAIQWVPMQSPVSGQEGPRQGDQLRTPWPGSSPGEGSWGVWWAMTWARAAQEATGTWPGDQGNGLSSPTQHVYMLCPVLGLPVQEEYHKLGAKGCLKLWYLQWRQRSPRILLYILRCLPKTGELQRRVDRAFSLSSSFCVTLCFSLFRTDPFMDSSSQENYQIS